MLEARCRAPTTTQRDVKRARIVLLAAEGRSIRSIRRGSGRSAAHFQQLVAAPEMRRLDYRSLSVPATSRS